jgi:hypothetical protein
MLTTILDFLQIILWKALKKFIVFDTPPNSLKDSKVNLKVKTTKEEVVGVCSLVCNT